MVGDRTSSHLTIRQRCHLQEGMSIGSLEGGPQKGMQADAMKRLQHVLPSLGGL